MTISASEFQKVRKRLGLTRNEFARELGLTGDNVSNYRTIERLELNKRPVSLPMAKLAWLLGQMGNLPDWPDDLLSYTQTEQV